MERKGALAPRNHLSPSAEAGGSPGVPRGAHGTVFPQQRVGEGGWGSVCWEKLRKGWENLLRELVWAQAQAGGPGKGDGDRGKEQRAGGRRKVGDGAKEAAVIGVRYGAGTGTGALPTEGVQDAKWGIQPLPR